MDRINDSRTEQERIALKLGGPGADQGAPAGNPFASDAPVSDTPKPIVGWMAVGLGLLGLFFSIFAIPFAVAFSVAALCVGQKPWGIGGLVLSVLGVVTSPTLVALMGLGAFLAMIGF